MPGRHAHYPNQRDELSAALHDAGITDRDLAITDYYDGGIQMLDPRGEPWQVIEGFDRSGGHFLTVLPLERRPSAVQFFKIEDSKMSGISCRLTGDAHGTMTTAVNANNESVVIHRAANRTALASQCWIRPRIGTGADRR